LKRRKQNNQLAQVTPPARTIMVIIMEVIIVEVEEMNDE
jgi:hypothetical protein